MSGPVKSLMIGLMSGTSLDGISAAVVRFSEPPLAAQLVGYVHRPYSAAERAELEHAMAGRATMAELTRLDFTLGERLAQAAITAIAEAGVARADVGAICSHGQTLWHEPRVATWQAGNAAVIAERVGVDVISDFRVRDMAAGGEGAPLVPIADALLFSGTDWRALLNLGGMANFTVVPPGGALEGVRAMDTGPGCAIIDLVARRAAPALPYDTDGALARAGTAVEPVVRARLADPWFALEPPKTTGRERFGAGYAEQLWTDCMAAQPGCTPADVVASAVAITARSIAHALDRFVAEPVSEVVASGGGARNPALMDALAAAIAPRRLVPFDTLFFEGEAKEAVAFALMGWLHLQRRPGNVPGATGARGPRILGTHTPA
ncbi:MAG: anhydro-N-acetylmuramic acid kinase [Gemmatimonadetes bacterium]|nr:anhydro-N-acetylmuramic acid kinase [Gemmatimonadota bacterium]